MRFPETSWIFFDCFNTLIDESDESEEEGGLCGVPQLAVAHGYFATPELFLAAYQAVRTTTLRHGRELSLGDRLKRTLHAAPGVRTPVEEAAEVKRLVAAWDAEFISRLRPTPGVQAMLEHWAGRRKIAVVANAFLPGLPERALQRFGLARFFQFFVDSASIGFKKPNPLLLMEALSQAGLAPADGGEVLSVGDQHDTDGVAALDLGMPVVHFNRQRTFPNVPPTPDGVPAIYDWEEFR